MTSRGSSRDAPVALLRFLEPLLPHLQREDVFEVSINEPGVAFVESVEGSAEVALPALSYAHLLTLAELIAYATQQHVSAAHPLLSASLPGGERVQVVRPPACEDGRVVMSFRRHGVRDLELQDYLSQGAFAGVRLRSADAERHGSMRRLLEQGDIVEFLRQAVRARCNIVVSGGTGSGKTTFINALLKELPAHERLVVIEDSRELRLRQRNCAFLLASRGGQGEAQVAAQDLLEASLRLRPDRILLGELRGGEAFAFLRAVNSGHPGSITSLHADSPERAFEQLVLMATPVARGMTGALIADYARSIIDVVVQLSRCPRSGRRQVSDIRLRPPATSDHPSPRLQESP